MSDRTAELMRLCFEKMGLDGDAVFFRNVMNALFETRHECRERLEEARVWFDKWLSQETQDLAWASARVSMLQEMVENKGVVIYMTNEMADTICSLGDNDPSVPLIEANFGGISLVSLKEMARAPT
jgi:hypothetical protein